MFFNKKEKKTTWKIDKLVTGFIIWGAIASIIGLSKTEKGKEVKGNISSKSRKVKKSLASKFKGLFNKGHSFFWKTIVKVLNIFNKNK